MPENPKVDGVSCWSVHRAEVDLAWNGLTTHQEGVVAAHKPEVLHPLVDVLLMLAAAPADPPATIACSPISVLGARP
eukprot:5700776-Pyramimonas_sp.AAC.1